MLGSRLQSIQGIAGICSSLRMLALSTRPPRPRPSKERSAKDSCGGRLSRIRLTPSSFTGLVFYHHTRLPIVAVVLRTSYVTEFTECPYVVLDHRQGDCYQDSAAARGRRRRGRHRLLVGASQLRQRRAWPSALWLGRMARWSLT
jgi:hypothetical protein